MITDEVCEEDSRNKVEAEESRENKGLNQTNAEGGIPFMPAITVTGTGDNGGGNGGNCGNGNGHLDVSKPMSVDNHDQSH